MMICGCGITKVNMKGQLEDWQNLHLKIEKMKELAPIEWVEKILYIS